MDVAHGKFHRQLRYKSAWNGAHYVEITRFFPSSKLCSTYWYCHTDLTLKDRVWRTPCVG
ncbi:MAG: zinc ribbon domain-containing protein [Candidatus Hodarchaeota archaeon]